MSPAKSPVKFPDGSKPASDKLSRAEEEYAQAEAHYKKAKETTVVDVQVTELLSAARALNRGISSELDSKEDLNQERIKQFAVVMSIIREIMTVDPPCISYKTVNDINPSLRTCLLALELYESMLLKLENP